MSDRMVPLPFDRMMEWVLKEKSVSGSIFGVHFPYMHRGGKIDFNGEKLETPFGPAAGPHTQLAQNIVAAYSAGARFFELKTVQIIDGENLHVAKPCIDARDECYNVEWSTELYVSQALEEYIKAWFMLKIISAEFSMGDPDGFVFNMSVGYDLDGIKSAKIDSFIEGLKDASGTKIWAECAGWAEKNISRFKHVDLRYIDGISSCISSSITLSTLHGCPSDEIERIAAYLLLEKHLNTFIKCNPTLLGYSFVRETMDRLGYAYIKFGPRHFEDDLQYPDAVAMLNRLSAVASKEKLLLGVKLTNTLPVDNPGDFIHGDEMYMSGRSLFPLTADLAYRLSEDMGDRIRISWSGGADAANICDLFNAGIWPVTLATTLLKPGGYSRLTQIAEKMPVCVYDEPYRVDTAALGVIAKESLSAKRYRKPIKQVPVFKSEGPLPLTDCFTAPCANVCPINQDIPEYISLAGRGNNKEALRLIIDKNPLPFITGTICTHKCMSRCTRIFYDESVRIRKVKLEAAVNGIEEVMKELYAPAVRCGAKVAVIGGGPAGLASAYFLGRLGIKAAVFEKSGRLGGVVRKIIPEFRINSAVIENDIELVKSMGADFILDSQPVSVSELIEKGYKYVIIATGAWGRIGFKLDKGSCADVFDFLADYKNNPEDLRLGANVAVIGGGNSAIDAARAAKRVKGVKKVNIIYRRARSLMPAEDDELELAANEGIALMELLMPVAHENGMLNCARVTLGEPDESGRSAPEVTNDHIYIPADTVISAVGGKVDTEIFSESGIALTGTGLVLTDPHTLETNINGVYAAGDARRGPASVVEAIADARSVADAIAKRENLSIDSCIRDERKKYSNEAAAKKGILCFAEEAAGEHERCLECRISCCNCVDVCPNRANVMVNVPGYLMPQIIHVDTICNECGNCNTFCPWKGAPYRDKFTYFTSPESFKNSMNSGFLPLSGGMYRIRLNGSIFTSGRRGREYPDWLECLVKAAVEQIPIVRR